MSDRLVQGKVLEATSCGTPGESVSKALDADVEGNAESAFARHRLQAPPGGYCHLLTRIWFDQLTAYVECTRQSARLQVQ